MLKPILLIKLFKFMKIVKLFRINKNFIKSLNFPPKQCFTRINDLY